MAKATKIKCAICGINPATAKNYVEINDTIHKMPSCGPCMTLNGCCVDVLMGTPTSKRPRFIKKWWKRDKRTTTLPEAYPSVDWSKVRCG